MSIKSNEFWPPDELLATSKPIRGDSPLFREAAEIEAGQPHVSHHEFDKNLSLVQACVERPPGMWNGGTAYIAGPMRGRKDFNFPAFDEAKRVLHRAGFAVVSPADIERRSHSSGLPSEAEAESVGFQRLCVARDVAAIYYVSDILAMLPGWENSVGASAEYALARWLKMPVIKALEPEVYLLPAHREDLVPVTVKGAGTPEAPLTEPTSGGEQSETILQEAGRLVSGARGEDYGHPLDDFTRAAQIWSAILGIKVTAEQVGMCMVGVKLAREVNRPKRDNRVDMAGYALCVDRCVTERARREQERKS